MTSIDTVADGRITGVTITGTAAQPTGPYTVTGTNQPNIGTNATFNIRRNFSAYDNIGIFSGGSGYKVGDRINIPGTSLEGSTPLNDVEMYVDGTSAGSITSVSATYTIANPGTNIDIISTITISEATSALIALNETISLSLIHI